VELTGLRPRAAVFTAHADRFLVAASGQTGARIDGDLAVEAAMRDAVLAGQVRVPRAVVWLPKLGGGGRDLQETGAHRDVRFVDQAALAAAEREAERRRAQGEQLRLDVRAQAGPVYVRSKDLDLELESHLHVTTARDGRPALAGQVRIRRGRINISGQRFDFDRGDVTLDGSPAPNPQLDIRLQRAYPDATVVIEIRGTPKKPELHLSSDPPIYDDAQIVSLILTGHAAGQASGGKSFDPTSAVATMVLGQLADKLAPQLGLDVLSVGTVQKTTAEGVATGDTDTRVEVGKYVSDRIYLSYAHVFGAAENANTNEAHVEYRLTRRWMLETIFGDAGVGSVDALWTYRY
jgi:translocation and assembly module TamB